MASLTASLALSALFFIAAVAASQEERAVVGFALQSDLQALKEQVAGLLKQGSGASASPAVPDLSSNVTALNAQVSSLTAQLTASQNQVAALQQKPDLSSNVTALNAQVSSLTAQLTASQNQASALQQQVKAIQNTPQPSSPGATVSFHAQSFTGALGANRVLPYSAALVNIGNGMNIATGVFTAPVAGTYYLAWSGVVSQERQVLVHMQSNYYNAAASNYLCSTYSVTAWTNIKCHAIASLKKGDTVGVYLDTYENASATSIGENGNKYTNFIGMLLG